MHRCLNLFSNIFISVSNQKKMRVVISRMMLQASFALLLLATSPVEASITLTIPSVSETGTITASWAVGYPFTKGELIESNDSSFTTLTAWHTSAPGQTSLTLTKAPGRHWFAVYAYTLVCYEYVGCFDSPVEIGGVRSVVVLPPPPTISTPGTSVNGGFTVSWSSSATATTYHLDRSVDGVNWSNILNANTSARSEAGLGNGTYRYRVRGCNADGCGAYSGVVATTVLYVPLVPATPTAPINNATGSYTVSWGAVPTASSYQLDRSSNGAAWTNIVNANVTSKLESNIAHGVHNYRLRACNSSGCSGYSSASTTTVNLIPAAPTVTSPGNSTTGSYTVSWSAPALATSYQLERSLDGTNWTNILNANATNKAESGLANGTYRYRVRACSAVGCSNYSAVVATTVLLPPSDIPTLSAPPNSTTGNFPLSWGSVATATSYQVQRSIDGGTFANVFSGAATGFSESALPNGTFRYQVRACNASGCSQYSPIATTIVLLPPSVPALSAPGYVSSGSYSVTWAASLTANGYVLERSVNGGAWANLYSGGALSVAEDGLADGTYYYRVQACNASGCSGWGTAATWLGLTPSIPTGLTAPPASETGIYSISWDSVSGVAFYELQERMNEGAWTSFVSPDTSESLQGRLIGGSFDYRVRACADQGACSDYSTIETVEVTASAPPLTSLTPAAIPAVAVAEVQASDLVDATAADFSVNQSGAATYTIPISAITGTAGWTPQIALRYSSQEANGLVGPGWTIQGVSAVNRCRATRIQDGGSKPITWTQSDRFCLDGQRLVLVSGGSYGAVGAVYKGEVDRHFRVTSVGGTPGNPSYFKIEYKDGSVAFYGGAPASRDPAATSLASGFDGNIVTGNGSIYTWGLAKHQDSARNPIWFGYYNDASGYAIRQITYAYGTGVGPSNHNAQMIFEYESRADEVNRYVSGHLLNMKRRLKKVTVQNAGQTIREFRLAYLENNPNVYTGPSRLSSLQECLGSLCKPATQFTWSSVATGFSGSPSAAFTLIGPGTQIKERVGSHLFSDINADGCADVIWQERTNVPDNRLFYAMGSCQNTPASSINFTLASFTNGSQVVPFNIKDGTLAAADYNVDGYSDVIVFEPKTEHMLVFLATPGVAGQWRLSSTPITALAAKPAQTPHEWETLNNHQIQDINADGLMDLVYRYTWSGLVVRYGELDPTQTDASNQRYRLGAAQSVAGVCGQLQYPSSLKPNGDVNGDGLSDFFVSDTGGGVTTISGTSASCFATRAAGDSPTPMDVNGDGLADLIGSTASESRVELNTGHGFQANSSCIPATASGACNDSQAIEWVPQMFDYNRDGYMDIVSAEYNTHQHRVRLWNPKLSNFEAPVPIVGATDSFFNNDQFVDVNGDGATDFVTVSTDGNTLAVRLGNGGGQPGHVIKQFADGYGNQVMVTYENLLASTNYQRLKIGDQPQGFSWGSHGYTYSLGEQGLFYAAINGRSDALDWAPFLPKVAVAKPLPGPFYAVTSVEQSAPSTTSSSSTLGGVQSQATAVTSYVYGEGRVEASSRGFLGFHTIQTLNHQSGSRVTTRYRQDFPFVGRPFSVKASTQAGRLISSADYWWDFQNRNSNLEHENAPYRPALTIVSASQYDSGSVGNERLSRVDTYSTYDGYGNATQVKEETFSDNGVTLVTRKQTDSSFGSTEEEQRLGLLSRAVVTQHRPSMTDVVRTVDFRYYGFGGIPCSNPTDPAWKGLLCQEIVEPLKSAYTLTTTHLYDSLGNRASSTVGGAGVTNRSTHWEYDALGRYRNKITNAKNQVTEEVIARNALGQPTTVKGLNGEMTQRRYGLLGRQYLEYSNDGAYALTLRYTSVSGCPVGTAFAETTTRAGGATNSTCHDKLGRPIRQMTLGFGGGWIYTDTEYDSLGRNKHVTEPYTPGSPVYFTTYNYDVLNRVTGVKRPQDSSVATTTAYVGLTTTAINAKSQQRIERRNAAGELIEVEDDLGGKVQYAYYADGSLRTTQVSGGDRAAGVPTGSLTTTLSYDDVGRRTAVNDPDKGSWSYQYNRFGEMTLQTDAKGQASAMVYDELGRLANRIDRRADTSIEANTNWVYDSASNGVGQLDYVHETVGGYIKAIEYDGLGRVAKTGISLSANESYFQRVSYDQYGRVYQQYDAAGPLSGTQNIYKSTGYLEAVVDPTAPATEFYRVSSMSPRGQVSSETNGAVATVRQYAGITGRLEEIRSTVGLANVQLLNYGYDTLGNLESRRDRSGGKDVTETFGYDDLNRLTSQQVGGQAAVVVAYDSFGNVKSKTGVGTYSYGSGSNGAGPHAVTTVTPASGPAATFSYDANGNNVSGESRSLQYTTFDKPHEITRFGHKTELSYDPDRAYYKRVDTTGSNQVTTTVYIGNVERVTKPDGSIQLRRYLPGNALLTQTYNSGGVLQEGSTRYLLKDHLGSLDVIVDHTGAVQQAQSFDAWGLRRDAGTWASLGISQLLAFDHSRTNRGFTGHEMLDEVGIVHMNGRIYEPKLGRFLQADPVVQFPNRTQSYNRYTYVSNSPLISIDPTGFVEEYLIEARRFSEILTYSPDGFAGMGSNFFVPIYSFNIDYSVNLSINIPGTVAVGSGEVKAPGTNQKTEELENEVIEEVTVAATRIDESLPPDPSLDPLNGTVEQVFTVDSLPQGRGVEGAAWISKILYAIIPVAKKADKLPLGLMDQMVLDAAKQGKGVKIIDNLSDPKFKGMEKWSYTERSANGLRSEVHYVRNPTTGELMDFKFKHHADTGR